jgi:4-amino-4-deoxy-L-arabinose transferase-like glycosyltransferase
MRAVSGVGARVRPRPAAAGPSATSTGQRAIGFRAALLLGTATGRRVALGLLLAVAGSLYSLGLSGSGWANAYYSAAAQAGASSWTAFFFGGLDPAGGITVDKPPAALWLMSLSVRVFGLSTPALLLPQALCTVAAVALLYGAVRRQASTLAPAQWARAGTPVGPEAGLSVDARAAAAGLLAGAVLALTPVVTLLSRYDNPDAAMVLLSVAAAYAVVRSVSSVDGGGGWLALGGALLGLAFLTKLLQAWLVVPAFAAVALLAGAGSLGRRLARTVAAGAAMIVAAGWWVMAVELTPPGHRPWIGGTQHNSVLELALGYNGLGRITGHEAGGGGGAPARPAAWWRLFGSWAPEASWLLPAALIALPAGWVLTRGRDRRDPVRAGLLLWGGWLLGAGAVLSSLHGISHSYYAIQLAPPVAGAVGLGGVLLWERARPAGAIRVRRLVAGTVSLTAVWSTGLLLSRIAWPVVAAPIALAAAAAAVAGLRVAAATDPGTRAASGPLPAEWPLVRRRVAGAAILVALLAGPAAWSVATAQAVHRGANVYARPGISAVRTPAGISPGSTAGTELPTALANRVRAGAGGYDWAAAVVGRRAADLQLASGSPVWALGGYSGREPHPTLAEFRSAVAASRVHYLVLAPGSIAPSRALGHRRLSAHPGGELADRRPGTRTREPPGLTGSLASPTLDRELDQQRGARPGRAADRDRPAQRLDPVGEPDQPRAASRVGTADPVITDRQVQSAVPHPRIDPHHRRPGVLGSIGEGFGHHVVRRHLDRLGQPSLDVHVEPHRDRRAPRERGERGTEAAGRRVPR